MLKSDKESFKYKSLPALRDRRVAKGFTQSEMINLINVATGTSYNRPYYTHIESGIRTVDPTLAVAISRILELPINELFQES